VRLRGYVKSDGVDGKSIMIYDEGINRNVYSIVQDGSVCPLACL